MVKQTLHKFKHVTIDVSWLVMFSYGIMCDDHRDNRKKGEQKFW